MVTYASGIIDTPYKMGKNTCIIMLFTCCLTLVSGKCHYNGLVYQEGDSFQSSDGCNSCSCSSGMVICTAMACLLPLSNTQEPCKVGSPLPSVFCGRGPNRQDCPSGYFCNVDPVDRFAVCCAQETCHYGGQTYHTGQSFPSSDGCNTCSCQDGMVGCTELACLNSLSTCAYNGTTYHNGDSFKSSDGCNTCGCNNGMVFCTLMACLDVVG